MPEGAAQEPGTSIRAAILDVNKRDGILDLSLQPRLLAAAAAAAQPEGQPPKKKKQRKGAEAAAVPAAPELKEGDSVEAVIELVGCDHGLTGRVHCLGGQSKARLLGFSERPLVSRQWRLHRQSCPMQAPLCPPRPAPPAFSL